MDVTRPGLPYDKTRLQTKTRNYLRRTINTTLFQVAPSPQQKGLSLETQQFLKNIGTSYSNSRIEHWTDTNYAVAQARTRYRPY